MAEKPSESHPKRARGRPRVQGGYESVHVHLHAHEAKRLDDARKGTVLSRQMAIRHLCGRVTVKDLR